MLQIKNVKKEYKTGTLIQKALDDVSLNLRDNEFVAILGPSGSGKTTLLNIIGGLDRYDSGDLIINGISTKDYSDRDWDSYRNHTIGFIFQSYNLIPHQTILANVELALTISGVTGKERKERALQALEKVGLKGQEYKRPSQLSGGQMQRVAIARALVNNPDIVLADEPTGALDSETSIQVMDLLKEVAKDRLVVMVTHNPELAEQYATRIVVLKDGTIRSDTDPYVVDDEIEAVHQNMGKSSMSILTALSLSFNNLKTKLTRTILVAFAGSIGIIGIALILSLSNGVNKYIQDTEEETLSEYPLEIQSDSFSLSSMMVTNRQSISGENNGDGDVHEMQIIGGMLSTVEDNDLGSLKDYFESGESGVEQYAKAIEYSYGITPQIYHIDADGNYRKVNPNDTFAPLGFSSSSNSMISSMMNMDVFFELPKTKSLYEDAYELKAGKWPTQANECVLVLTENNQVSDFVLYMLGLKDPDELDEYVELFANNESVTVETSSNEYSYEDFLGLSFKVVDSSSYYTYDDTYDVYSDRSEDKTFMKALVQNGYDLNLVGIVAPTEDTSVYMLSTGIYYDSSLIDLLRENAAKSEVVKEQKNNPTINILTGKPFGEDSDPLDMNELFKIDKDRITSAFKIDTNALQVDTSVFNTIDYQGAVSENMFDGVIPDLSAQDIEKMFASINIKVSQENLMNTFNAVMKDYLEKASSDPSTDYEKLSTGLTQYFNSEEGQQLLATEIMKLLEGNKDNLLSTETVRKALKEIMTAYLKYVSDKGLEINDESFDAFLDSEEGSALVNKQMQIIMNEIFNNMHFEPEQLKNFGQAIIKGYIEYAKANDLPDPDKFTESFKAYLETDAAQSLIQAGIKSSITNYDEIEQQLVSIYSGLTGEVESNLTSVMQAMMSNVGTEITSAMTQAMYSIVDSIPNAFSVDGNALANSFSLNMGEEELQALMTSMMTSASSSLQKNLTAFGYAEEDDLSSITIYPYDFESKEEITNILDAYNTMMEESNQEEKKISYTDMVGTLMSSVTDIINTISYVLVAFVAISLVVSSIMIGVITYISVLERKKEIGILRAMGASKNNISQVFNAETFITGLLAGLIGIGITLVLLHPANYLIHKIGNTQDVNAYLELSSALILILLSICLTLLGGLIPSKKAAKSDPVAALRSE